MTSLSRASRDLQIERGGKMQRLELFHPGEGHMVIGPASFDGHCDYRLRRIVRTTVIGRRNELDHVDGFDWRSTSISMRLMHHLLDRSETGNRQ